MKPARVIDIELSQPIGDVADLDDYEGVWILVRLHGAPIAQLMAPSSSGRCLARTLINAILAKHTPKIIRTLVRRRLEATPLEHLLRIEELFEPPVNRKSPPVSPTVTVAVCTKDRTSDLEACLDSLLVINYPDLDVLVIDNAPTTDGTKRLLHERYPSIRYLCEPRPGLDWARNRAIIEARGEIIAYTDDDVVVDPDWVRALADVFADNPDVMAVTGLVVPFELETFAQQLFENYGGFGRGFEQMWAKITRESKRVALQHGGTGKFGTGANMAFRRRVFDEIGLFDPALDVGTVTNGGGDTEMFFRVIKEGYALVYEPNAVVRHRHRREYAGLLSQMEGWGAGYFSSIIRTMRAYPDERWNLIWLGTRRMYRHFSLLAWSLVVPNGARGLIWAESRGSLSGLFAYQRACGQAKSILETFGPQTAHTLEPIARSPIVAKTADGLVASRTVDLSRPLEPLTRLRGHHAVRVDVHWKNASLGTVEIDSFDDSVRIPRLLTSIADGLTYQLFEPDQANPSAIHAALVRHYMERTSKLD